MATYAGQYGPEALLFTNGAPVLDATVTVYQEDGTTLATLYTSHTKGATTANPTTTDSYGNLTFYADPGRYVLNISTATVTRTLPVNVEPDPAEPLGASGAGLPDTPVTKTATYTAAASELVLANAATAGFTVTLPSAPATGALVTVKKTDGTANVVTVLPAGGGTIDGDPNATIVSPKYGAVFEHTGSNVWQIVAVTSAGGTNGVNGNTLLNGAAAPSAGVGVNGDFYLETTNKRLYGPKASGSWPGSYTSLIGPSGTNGTNGTNGAISQIQGNGSNVTVRPTVDFEGAAVSVTDDSANNRTKVTLASAPTVLSAWRSGVRYANAGGSVGTQSLTADQMVCVPLRVPNAVTINEIAIHVNGTVGTTGSVIRLGIYADSSSGPGSLILDAGTVVSTSTGLKTITISQALAAGVVWVVCASQGGASTQPQVVTDSGQAYFDAAGQIGFMPDGTLFNVATSLTQASVSGALPSTASATTLSQLRPRIALKVA